MYYFCRGNEESKTSVKPILELAILVSRWDFRFTFGKKNGDALQGTGVFADNPVKTILNVLVPNKGIENT